MNPLDVIKEKRKEAAEKNRSQSLVRSLSRKPISDVGRRGMVMASALSKALAEDDAKSHQRDTQIQSKVSNVESQIKKSFSVVDTQYKGLSAEITSLKRELQTVISVGEKQMQVLSNILVLVKKPIKIPTPQVTVQERSIDLSEIHDAIRQIAPPNKSEKQMHLSDYRAHDIDTAPDGTQYIGFIASDGRWHIAHSDDKQNTLRYYSSKGDYHSSWDERYSHEYTTLNEAMRNV